MSVQPVVGNKRADFVFLHLRPVVKLKLKFVAMAAYQNHISFSAACGLVYSLLGIFAFEIHPEQALLAGMVVVICGMLPDIDSANNAPARELSGFLAALLPLTLMQFFPAMKAGGVSRIALIVVCCYLFTRIVVVRLLQRYASKRGMIHSIPAAIITSELVYLMFNDLFWYDRIYVTLGALLGYLSHLLLDATSNVDLLGTAIGQKSNQGGVLKIVAPSWASTIMLYSLMLALGYVVYHDVAPDIRAYRHQVQAGS